jgi:hypothetical protein
MTYALRPQTSPTSARRSLVASALLGIAALPAHSTGASTPDLFSMSLEQLSAVEVSSVSRKRQSIVDTAAAVHVITAEALAAGWCLRDMYQDVSHRRYS